MEEGIEPGERITIEAKIFSCNISGGMVLIKEIQRQGVKEILLSAQQANWVLNGLSYRSNNFGETRRKEKKCIDGRDIALIEGRNSKGCFLAIHSFKETQVSDYLIVPSGRHGYHWNRLAKLLKRVIDRNSWNSSTSGRSHTVQGVSYADAILGNRQVVKETSVDIQSDGNVSKLLERIGILENELELLKAHFRLESSFSDTLLKLLDNGTMAAQSPKEVRTMALHRRIYLDQTASINHQEPVNSGDISAQLMVSDRDKDYMPFARTDLSLSELLGCRLDVGVAVGSLASADLITTAREHLEMGALVASGADGFYALASEGTEELHPRVDVALVGSREHPVLTDSGALQRRLCGPVFPDGSPLVATNKLAEKSITPTAVLGRKSVWAQGHECVFV